MGEENGRSLGLYCIKDEFSPPNVILVSYPIMLGTYTTETKVAREMKRAENEQTKTSLQQHIWQLSESIRSHLCAGDFLEQVESLGVLHKRQRRHLPLLHDVVWVRLREAGALQEARHLRSVTRSPTKETDNRKHSDDEICATDVITPPAQYDHVPTNGDERVLAS